MDEPLLEALVPVILLLACGVLSAILSRTVRTSPVVGYLVLGVVLNATGLATPSEAITVLAELGVIFLLFDVGLHFSTRRLREQAGDIFGFGPVQILFSTLGLGLVAMTVLPPFAAFFVGATLSLSSTAVVARIIAERHQQSCPVGLTATSILVFQDLAAIFLLIIATTLGTGTALAPAVGTALAMTIGAFGVALICARFIVRPAFDLIARIRTEEVLTATALLIALAAAWGTGAVGLSLTLGAFLGGMMLADTPYRAIIQSEIKPFRGLLLGFFFITVGLTLNPALLVSYWPHILGVAVTMVAAKVALNAAASLIFRWSVPGSAQLGFLLAQGSEFAFIILSLPQVRAMIGELESNVLLAAVVLSLAATPTLSEMGRTLAGRLRRGGWVRDPAELVAADLSGPALIVGMGPRGRTVADALTDFGIPYAAIESDPDRLRKAIADGYRVMFGDMTDPRIWEPAAMHDRRVSVITMPSIERSSGITAVARLYFPNLMRFALVDTIAEAPQFASVGLVPVVDSPDAPGIEAAVLVLAHLGADPDAIAAWSRRQRNIVGQDGAAYEAPVAAERDRALMA